MRRRLVVRPDEIADSNRLVRDGWSRWLGHSDAKQTVKVEPTIANRAEDAQAQITTQAGAVQTQKLKKARENVAASGPILGDAIRPTALEPTVREYHTLLQKVCTQFPLLSSIERNDDRLAEYGHGEGGGDLADRASMFGLAVSIAFGLLEGWRRPRHWRGRSASSRSSAASIGRPGPPGSPPSWDPEQPKQPPLQS
jgi:hypothetical protein